MFDEKYNQFNIQNHISDCVMTYWTHWSSCSSKCGRGTYERKRNVHIPPSGGGAACDARRQVSYCYGNDRSCGKRGKLWVKCLIFVSIVYLSARSRHGATNVLQTLQKIKPKSRIVSLSWDNCMIWIPLFMELDE